MTIPSTARKAGPLLGTGSQTVWPFTFKVFAAADVAVSVTNAAGVITVLVLDSDYSVTLNGNQDTSPGGTVTYPISGAALPVGSALAIIGDLDYDQVLDLPSGGNFSPASLENQLDRATMQIQQLKELSDRSAKMSVFSSPADVDLLTSGIVTLAEIDTEIVAVADNEANVNIVASNIGNVNAVGGNIANVVAAAENAANINSAVANEPAIDAVAGSIGSVNTVAGNISLMNTVVDNLALWRDVTAGDDIQVTNFSGTGAQVAFTLPFSPGVENNTQVFISGVYQQKTEYTVSGTTLTFGAAPPVGVNNIEVVWSRPYVLGATDAALVNYLPAGTGAVATTVQEALRALDSYADSPRVFKTQNYGITPDGIRSYGNMTSGSAVLTDASGKFTSADVGKKIAVVGASSSYGKTLSATISSFQSINQVTLSTDATQSVTGGEYVYGTDFASEITALGVLASQSNAVDGKGGAIVFAPGIYISCGAVLSSFVDYYGYDNESELVNTDLGRVPLFSHGITRDNYPYYNYKSPVGTVSAGSLTITMASAGDAAYIGTGLCLIRTTACLGATAATSQPAPLAAEIINVLRVSGSTLILDKPIAYTLVSPLVAKQNGYVSTPAPYPDNWIQQTSVHNLAISNLIPGSHLLINASYECNFYDLTLRGSVGITGNGHNRSSWRRITQYVLDRALETKTASVLTSYEDITTYGNQRIGSTTSNNICDVGEGAKGITYNNCVFHYEGTTFENSSLIGPGGSSGSSDVTMSNMKFYAAAASSGLFHVMTYEVTDKNFNYENIEFHVPALGTMIAFLENNGGTAPTNGVVCRNITSEYAPSVASIYITSPTAVLNANFINCEANAPLAIGTTTLVTGLDFDGCKVSNFGNLTKVLSTRIRNTRRFGDSIVYANRPNLGQYQTVTATTPNSVYYSYVLPAYANWVGGFDRIKFRLQAICMQPVAHNFVVQVLGGPSPLAIVNSNDGSTNPALGPISTVILDVTLRVLSTGGFQVSLYGYNGGTMTNSEAQYNVDPSATGITLQFQLWSANTGSINVRDFTVVPELFCGD